MPTPLYSIGNLLSGTVAKPEMYSALVYPQDNELIIQLNPMATSLRNLYGSNGRPTPILLREPMTLTIPQGATLGGVAGVQQRILVGLVWSQGHPVLCAGDLDGNPFYTEADLVQPTLVSTGADLATVLYSNAAVPAPSPFKTLGVFGITQATPGNWVSRPSYLLMTGQQAVFALRASGATRNLIDQTANRTVNVVYYNDRSTDRDVYVYSGFINDQAVEINMELGPTLGTLQLVDRDGIGRPASGLSGYMGVQAKVPPNWAYRVSGNTGGIAGWKESN